MPNYSMFQQAELGKEALSYYIFIDLTRSNTAMP